jgi:DNA (cytosine-5)-methyltransferase 1
MQKGITQVLRQNDLLPTPIVSDAKGTGPADANRDTTQLRAMNILLPTVTTQESHSGPSQLNRNTVPLNALVGGLLPTPVASEGTKASAAQSSSRRAETGQVFLTNIIHDVAVENGKPVPQGNLLPTTRTSMANGPTQKELDAGNPKSRLETVTNWGKFEPAIRRWEQTLGRPAPSPTKPDGKEGNHRLSSAFTEWMMGLPSGWITEVGLSRNDELKACGNGVVPQQAELALRALLEGVAIPSGGGK